ELPLPPLPAPLSKRTDTRSRDSLLHPLLCFSFTFLDSPFSSCGQKLFITSSSSSCGTVSAGCPDASYSQEVVGLIDSDAVKVAVPLMHSHLSDWRFHSNRDAGVHSL
ncbi:hypothetical protein XENORESO_018254, partial [Xenotaenia resolanae]